MSRKNESRPHADTPDLPANLEDLGLSALRHDSQLSGLAVHGESESFPFDEIDATECVLEDVDFSSHEFRLIDVGDVIFRRCDFSATQFPSRSRLKRVRFEDCRAAGFNVSESTLSDIHVESGKFELAMFRMSKLEHVVFDGTQAPEIDFYGSELVKCALLNCELHEASFESCSLADVFLHGSAIESLRGVDSMAGVHISRDQLFQLADVLAANAGIRIDS